MWQDDGCFVQLKHVVAIGFAAIKAVYKWITSLLLCVLQAQWRCCTLSLECKLDRQDLQFVTYK
jgi:hypothetical protein